MPARVAANKSVVGIDASSSSAVRGITLLLFGLGLVGDN